MPAQLLDGKLISKQIQSETRQAVAHFIQAKNPVPTLAAVLVGDDPASHVYVSNKERACHRVGIDSRLFRLPAHSTTSEVVDLVEQLNSDPAVHGILVQLPLPPQCDTQSILDTVDPNKDVDAFHPHNVGLISQGRPRFLPCTPHGVVQLLKRYQLSTSGKHVCVIGRSDIVGKPMAMMLVQKDFGLGPEMANATVTICHSRTKDLKSFTRNADFVVAAIGRPNFVTAEMIKPGAVVVDVGINRTSDGLVGDVDFDSVSRVAGWITPVPGGVGPLTVTMLLENTLAAAKQSLSVQDGIKMTSGSQLVEVYRAMSTAQAYTLSSKLDQAGIPAVIENEFLQNVTGVPMTWATAPRIMVDGKNAAAARKMLEQLD